MSNVDVRETLNEAERKATQLPIPKGWKLLCMVPAVEKAYDSGLVKSGETVDVEEQVTQVLFVIKFGDMAYKDEKKFPTGPWCKEGDFVIVRAYSGTRLKIHGREFRIINDDTVEGVVEDPRGITRV